MTTLSEEQAALQRVMPALVAEHVGQIVLFRGEPVAYFQTYADAFREGLSRFGLGVPFVIDVVAPPDGAQASPALELGVMFRG